MKMISSMFTLIGVAIGVFGSVMFDYYQVHYWVFRLTIAGIVVYYALLILQAELTWYCKQKGIS